MCVNLSALSTNVDSYHGSNAFTSCTCLIGLQHCQLENVWLEIFKRLCQRLFIIIEAGHSLPMNVVFTIHDPYPCGQAASRSDDGHQTSSKRQPQTPTPNAEGQAEGQLAAADQQTERQPESSSLGTDRQHEGNTVGNKGDDSDEISELESTWEIWEAFQELLPVQRHWWKKLHFRCLD